MACLVGRAFGVVGGAVTVTLHSFCSWISVATIAEGGACCVVGGAVPVTPRTFSSWISVAVATSAGAEPVMKQAQG